MAQNFEIGLGKHFNLTTEYVTSFYKDTRYIWAPVGIDYNLPELTIIDYRTQCPLFGYLIEPGHQNEWTYQCISFWEKRPYMVVRATGAELEVLQLQQFCAALSYLRFEYRDLIRKRDSETWEALFETHFLSDYTVPLFSEDLELSYEWAKEVFPNNIENASVGKAGEFAFSCWATENELPISPIEVNKNDGPDKYDFLGFGSVKIDVKTYHDLTTNSKRRHWNISSTSLKGSYAKELFVFVVLAEDKKTATIVGMLSAEQILKKGKPQSSDFDSYNPKVIYRIEQQHLMNPDYLKVVLDPLAQMEVLFSDDPAKEIAEQVRRYPIDTLSRSYMDEDINPWEVKNYNLTKPPTKKSKRKKPKGFG